MSRTITRRELEAWDETRYAAAWQNYESASRRYTLAGQQLRAGTITRVAFDHAASVYESATAHLAELEASA
jgi:hypothetical protein